MGTRLGVLILTLVTSLFIAGPAWLLIGNRIPLSEDDTHNDRLNFAVYFIGTLPVSFVLIFFGLGG